MIKKYIEEILENEDVESVEITIKADESGNITSEVQVTRSGMVEADSFLGLMDADETCSPSAEMSLEEAQEKYDNLEIGPDPEADEDDVDLSEIKEESEVKEEEIDTTEETSPEENPESDAKTTGDEEFQDEFGHMFSEDEDTEQGPQEERWGEGEEEPSDEDREEAEEDFREVFNLDD